MQLKKPDDFVIATGKQYSVRDFVNISAKYLGININGLEKELMRKVLIKNRKNNC